MTIRIAAIEVGHWHALHDAAYLRHLVAMPDVELVAVQDTDAGLVARRAAEVGNPATFTDYRQMLTSVRPDFVLALGRHCQMAGIAHHLLEEGYPFLMEKPMGQAAGMAASLTGSYSTAAGALFGTLIARQFNGTILPLFTGFAVLGFCALLSVLLVEGRAGLFRGE